MEDLAAEIKNSHERIDKLKMFAKRTTIQRAGVIKAQEKEDEQEERREINIPTPEGQQEFERPGEEPMDQIPGEEEVNDQNEESNRNEKLHP